MHSLEFVIFNHFNLYIKAEAMESNAESKFENSFLAFTHTRDEFATTVSLYLNRQVFASTYQYEVNVDSTCLSATGQEIS